jgi:hypothetical protein
VKTWSQQGFFDFPGYQSQSSIGGKLAADFPCFIDNIKISGK